MSSIRKKPASFRTSVNCQSVNTYRANFTVNKCHIFTSNFQKSSLMKTIRLVLVTKLGLRNISTLRGNQDAPKTVTIANLTAPKLAALSDCGRVLPNFRAETNEQMLEICNFTSIFVKFFLYIHMSMRLEKANR